MKRLGRISYLYFAVGLIICLYSLISEVNQTLNIEDTYFVILFRDFAFFVMMIYTAMGLTAIFIGKYIRYAFQLSQFLMFCIPFIYYVFLDFINHNDPAYYMAHPIAFQWEVVYIPIVLFLTFLTSIVVFCGFVVFSTIKMIKER